MSFADMGEGFGSMVGGIGALLFSGKGGRNTLRELRNLYMNLRQPDFDMSELTPEQLELAAEYFPEQYAARLPEQAQTIADSPELRRQLGENVDYFRRVREEGMPLAERVAAEQAAREVAKEHRQALQSGMESLQRRGRAGGGAEAAMRLGGAQQASELARALAADRAQEAQMNRYRAAMDLSRYGGELRGQDIALRGRNADIMNRYNELVSQMLTNEARENAQARQAAQWQNAAEAQRIADWNTINRQNVNESNLNRRNLLTQQGYENELARMGGLSDSMKEYARAQYAEQAARRDNIYNINRAGGRAGGAMGGMFASQYGGGGFGGGGGGFGGF